ncbi:MAG: hypothetical protein MRJ67_10885 [Nitrospirales bacterium]|nr:hypothetical protein [Nitrospirales bacterium]
MGCTKLKKNKGNGQPLKRVAFTIFLLCSFPTFCFSESSDFSMEREEFLRVGIGGFKTVGGYVSKGKRESDLLVETLPYFIKAKLLNENRTMNPTIVTILEDKKNDLNLTPEKTIQSLHAQIDETNFDIFLTGSIMLGEEISTVLVRLMERSKEVGDKQFIRRDVPPIYVENKEIPLSVEIVAHKIVDSVFSETAYFKFPEFLTVALVSRSRDPKESGIEDQSENLILNWIFAELQDLEKIKVLMDEKNIEARKHNIVEIQAGIESEIDSTNITWSITDLNGLPITQKRRLKKGVVQNERRWLLNLVAREVREFVEVLINAEGYWANHILLKEKKTENEYEELAKKFFQEGNYSAAIMAYRFVGLDPRNQSLMLLRISDIYIKMDKFSWAMEELSLWEEIEPEDIFNEEALYLITQASYGVGKYSAAITRGQQLLRIPNLENERTVNTLQIIAKSYEHIDNLSAAIDYYKQALNLKENDKALNLSISRILVEQNKFDQASLQLEKAYSLAGNDKPKEYSELFKEIATEWFSQGFYHKAILNVDSALTIDPNDTKLYRLKALSLKRLKKLEEAKSTLSLAISKNGDDWRTYAFLGDLHRITQDYASGKIILLKALDRFPKEGQLRAIYSRILLEENRLDEAEKEIQIALQIEPDISYIHWVFGKVLLAKKLYDRCVEQGKKAIELDSDFGRGYILIYEANHFAGKDLDSIEIFKKHLIENMDSEEVRRNLAVVYQEYLMNYSQAYKIFKILASSWPNFQNKVNFVESNITTGRYSDAYEESENTLKSNEFPVGEFAQDDKLNLLGLRFAALALMGDLENGLNSLQQMLEFYESLPTFFQTEWSHKGLENYLCSLESPTVGIILYVLDSMKMGEKDGIRNLQILEKELEASKTYYPRYDKSRWCSGVHSVKVGY